MQKTLVRFNLDHDVLLSIAYVSGMKIFCVLVKVWIKVKSQSAFENLKFWNFENFEILKDWF